MNLLRGASRQFGSVIEKRLTVANSSPRKLAFFRVLVWPHSDNAVSHDLAQRPNESRRLGSLTDRTQW
jgi:hypothetical protein